MHLNIICRYAFSSAINVLFWSFDKTMFVCFSSARLANTLELTSIRYRSDALGVFANILLAWFNFKPNIDK